MALNKEQEDLYRKTMEEAKAQLETIDDEMEKEIQRARERLAKLQDSKRSFRQLYEGAARLLNVKIESESQDREVKQVTAEAESEGPSARNPESAEEISASTEIAEKTDPAPPQQA